MRTQLWVKLTAPNLAGLEGERPWTSLRLLGRVVGAVLLSRMTATESLTDKILNSCWKVKP
jgi:hypothetical protein